MAYCTSCGTQMEGQFCPKCGAPAGVAPAAPITKSGGSTRAGLGVNGASALCYLFGFITGIVFLVLAPYNQERRVRFHAFQSIFLSVAVAVLHVGVTIVALMLGMINLALGVLISSLHAVVSLGFFVVLLYMMWKSYQGEKVMLPVIGELAEGQAGGKGSDSERGTMGRAA
jgi:uncharacterized membrane protein